MSPGLTYHWSSSTSEMPSPISARRNGVVVIGVSDEVSLSSSSFGSGNADFWRMVVEDIWHAWILP